jgi:predicted component of type VI protein secretion system
MEKTLKVDRKKFDEKCQKCGHMLAFNVKTATDEKNKVVAEDIEVSCGLEKCEFFELEAEES